MGSSSPLPTHKFDYNKIIKIIITIEEVIDNDELSFEGISIWPLIRQQLWSNLQSTKKFEKVFEENVGECNKNNSHKISVLSKLKRVNIFNVRHYKRYYEKYNSYNQCKSELLRIRNQIERSSNKYEKVVLLNSKAIYYQLNTEKGWVNVHIDPIYDIYKKANRTKD